MDINKTITSSPTPIPEPTTFKPEEKLYAEVPNYELKITDYHENTETSTNQIPEMTRDIEETTKKMLTMDEISTEQNQSSETATELLDDISNSTESNNVEAKSIHTSTSESSSVHFKEDLVLKDLGNEQKLMKSDIKNVEFKTQNFEYEETTEKSNNDFDVFTTTEKDYSSTRDHK